ncbi:hypothetical protein LEP1GSC034_1803 [Leptospira interrogans str. 2003000735]|uniref:Uncharacterized protein n=2 Tax=Leptospira interrogans TaxID=173 RepID=A0A829D7P1_LEPIR|nr:hypothetical protein LEP1GSC027_4311 [Leptospira interrogans str. 2002000624]EKQ37991.1 hypothetical protein LEP1GSC025_4264 [Leptospira interrogans str. 2002000621]EKQ49854.1 hypothetical protein LEP1GSC026_4243 [Leptospira interrogans str. 2002000623]EMJ66622.1 hypothetical protein LEP1GSC034_1803 [Leptospira interrogans str. 2003000735]EMJ70034.1 hypothetical protein LEP1GSC033_0657 [Leptospira interrogans str. 2002000632]EMJ77056.1 hypothetical protein LEP1GSC032_2550 [Leptospira interr
MIHFSEKKFVNFTNQFLKCGNWELLQFKKQKFITVESVVV